MLLRSVVIPFYGTRSNSDKVDGCFSDSEITNNILLCAISLNNVKVLVFARGKFYFSFQ
jgi:hypothetical protein